jgi:hypothetical protein
MDMTRTLPRPVPREAVLIVNAHSRRGRDLFREAAAKLEMSGIRLTASHAVKDPRQLIPTMQKAVADGAPMIIVGGGDGSAPPTASRARSASRSTSTARSRSSPPAAGAGSTSA